jgi:membrane protein implicated in regulation of membrane protease activity
MALPWIGAGFGIAGGWQLGHSNAYGWWMIGAGAAALIADLLIDVLFAKLAIGTSDQPDLNRRAAQLIGRLLVVAEAIEGGRGKVRAGDTLWAAEGPDTPAGGSVSVTGTNGTALVVERAQG